MEKNNMYISAALKSITDLLVFFGRFVLKSTDLILSIINLIIPYICLFVGQYCRAYRGCFAVGGEAFLPIIAFVVVAYLNRFMSRIGKGSDIPIPDKRFTKVYADGEVTIDKNRMEDLILYLSDLEDWMEKKRLI